MLDRYKEFDVSYKVLLLGDAGVGKSQLLSRYAKNEFSLSSKSTVGLELGSRLLKIDGDIVRAMVWDTAGQERYRAILNTYYRGAEGVILVYDITNRRTFENLATWMKEIREHTVPGINIILIGNKTDICDIREVSVEEAQKFGKTHGLHSYEASALNTANVENIFETLFAGIRFDNLIYINESRMKARKIVMIPEW